MTKDFLMITSLAANSIMHVQMGGGRGLPKDSQKLRNPDLVHDRNSLNLPVL